MHTTVHIYMEETKLDHHTNHPHGRHSWSIRDNTDYGDTIVYLNGRPDHLRTFAAQLLALADEQDR
jgi:hypothetical protein